MFTFLIIIFVFFLLLLGLEDYAKLSMFIEIQSMAYVLFLAIFSAFICVPYKKLLNSFKNYQNSDDEVKKESYLTLKHFSSILGTSALLVGLFFTATFWISLAQQANELHPSDLTLSLSFSLFYSAYGLIIKIITFLISSKLTVEIASLKD